MNIHKNTQINTDFKNFKLNQIPDIIVNEIQNLKYLLNQQYDKFNIPIENNKPYLNNNIKDIIKLLLDWLLISPFQIIPTIAIWIEKQLNNKFKNQQQFFINQDLYDKIIIIIRTVIYIEFNMIIQLAWWTKTLDKNIILQLINIDYDNQVLQIIDILSLIELTLYITKNRNYYLNDIYKLSPIIYNQLHIIYSIDDIFNQITKSDYNKQINIIIQNIKDKLNQQLFNISL